MPKNKRIRSILVIGSGPIIIGQACEFDYSGSQAARALREEGLEVTLINSNPATIMTDPVTADNIYLDPLDRNSILKILQQHHIDAVLPTMGGQTALNLAIDCQEEGIWEDYGVDMIGVDVEAIKITEDRERFRQKMLALNINVCQGKTAKSFLEGKEIAQEIGFPLVIRPSFTLGGSGGSFVEMPVEFEKKLTTGLHRSPIHEVLIEKSILGWKEYELELLRDSAGNIVIICAIENFDPMGIHTGDSITVAPPMTLSDTAYQQMRNLAIKMINGIGEFAGGCNIQFALNPVDETIIAIEINPRVSRSSALASKATGYPIAKVASKLAIGYHLDELTNSITNTTSAFFEPSLDYVIVKIPRWNFDKFKGSDATLGLQMKAVGEVMGIGRTFQEALQKATHSLELQKGGIFGLDDSPKDQEQVRQKLKDASADRLFYIYEAFRIGLSRRTIYNLTQIDPWFLEQIEQLFKFEQLLVKYSLDSIMQHDLNLAKQKGFSDVQIAKLLNTTVEKVKKKRQAYGIERVWKRVDTCAAEFEAQTPYYYSTFEKVNESLKTEKDKIIILGSGPNRIGQGIEFDYCCVHGVLAVKESGYEAIMINCNPETVSTDFDIADKLYFEPVFWEYIEDIINHEQPVGIIVQLGGQTALKLAKTLNDKDIPIIGTSYQALDLAEDRGRFSKLLQDLNIPYPKFGVVTSTEQGFDLAKILGFPLLIRPSYVLGGQNMNIVINEQEMEKHLIMLFNKMPGNQVLMDNFLENAIEAEADALCDGEEVYIIGIMEHIEPAGIHSGDSYAVLPPYNLGNFIIEQIEHYTKTIALALKTVGHINIQFAIKNDHVYVIEANPRASRTVPFICKSYGEPYVKIATQIMLGHKRLADFKLNPQKHGYAIKIPVFSFDKFPNVNKELGPEMKSTGEGIYFIKNLRDRFFLDTYNKKNLYLSR